jgi:UDP-N-acetylmuramate--alanine ligase
MSEANLTSADFCIVKSTAVEDNVPDVITANRLKIEQIMRSDLLAKMFNEKRGLAIGGTAGKTTTTGLLAWILKFAGKEPSCAVGGIISGLNTNAFRGKGPDFVIEADESDGSIVKYRPYVSVVTNISRDHKSLEDLKTLFKAFFENTSLSGLRLACGDDPNSLSLQKELDLDIKTYGTSESCDYRAEKIVINNEKATFSMNGEEFEIKLPGHHNVLNTVAAIAAAEKAGVTISDIKAALKAFPGMKRRFEKVGVSSGVTVIDDFAHNPAEIAAAIETARKSSNKRFLVYQPHGYGPTSFTKADLVKVFGSLQPDEFLYLDDIFYAGGTVDKSISSKDIIDEVNGSFKNAFYLGDREKIIQDISKRATNGDMVLVMGARDINLICQRILAEIPNQNIANAG